MLLKNIQELIQNGELLQLFPEELSYVKQMGLLSENMKVVELNGKERFLDAYFERSDKETEEFLGEESSAFLSQPISYFKEHKNEFLYVESKWFSLIGVDAISFEVDDVFGTYDVLLGLKRQKKYADKIRNFFVQNLTGDELFELMFDAQEGIWNVNFSFNQLASYREDITIGEAYLLIYQFLFNLAIELE